MPDADSDTTDTSDPADAPASDLQRLLEVQEHDTRIDQLRHKLATLPEREAMVEADRGVGQAQSDLAAAQARSQALTAEQEHLEGEIAAAQARIASAESNLYGGSVSSPRDLQALQDEIASVKRRIGLLEDSELEVMEQLEPVDADVAAQTATIERLTAEKQRLEVQLTAAEAELQVELAREAEARTAAGASVPAALLAEYESIRSRSGGVGAAKYSAGQCGGCHIRLPAMEIDRIKKLPPDAVVHCEECGRLLVR